MPRVRGVRDGEVLSASFDGRIKKEFKDLKMTKVLLLVSIVGNEHCSDAYLEASIANGINQHGEATILLADQVYWNNLRTSEAVSEIAQQELTAEAIRLGDEFIARNLSRILRPLDINEDDFRDQYGSLNIDEQVNAINKLAKEKAIGLNLVRWADWINGSEAQLTQVATVMDANRRMQESIDKTANDFASRHAGEENPETWALRSKTYLREETPAVIWLSAFRGYEFIAYPGDMIAPFEAAKEIFFNPADSTFDSSLAIQSSQPLANWLDIHFRRALSKEQLLQQSLIKASSTVGARRSTAHSPGFFSAGASYTQELTPEHAAILSMVREIIEAPGEQEFKLSVLTEAITALRASQTAPVSLNSTF